MDDVARIAEGLSTSMAAAICAFEPLVWYGVALPVKWAAGHKGHAVRNGLMEHDGESPTCYRLTPLGQAVRAYLLEKE